MLSKITSNLPAMGQRNPNSCLPESRKNKMLDWDPADSIRPFWEKFPVLRVKPPKEQR